MTPLAPAGIFDTPAFQAAVRRFQTDGRTVDDLRAATDVIVRFLDCYERARLATGAKASRAAKKDGGRKSLNINQLPA